MSKIDEVTAQAPTIGMCAGVLDSSAGMADRKGRRGAGRQHESYRGLP